MPELERQAERYELDIALVLRDGSSYDAAQAERAACYRWPDDFKSSICKSSNGTFCRSSRTAIGSNDMPFGHPVAVLVVGLPARGRHFAASPLGRISRSKKTSSLSAVRKVKSRSP